MKARGYTPRAFAFTRGTIMAIQFIDGFDHYNIGDILSKWSNLSNGGAQSLSAGRFNGKCLTLPRFSSSTNIQKVVPVPLSNFVLGFAFRCGASVSSQCNLVSFNQGATEQVSVALNSDGTLSFQRGGTNLTATNATGYTHMNVNQWSYIEIQVSIAPSVGASTCMIYVNSVLMQTLNAAQSTDPADAGHFGTLALSISTDYNPSNPFQFDDLYLLNIDGVTTGPLGDSRIEALYPTAPGSNTNWTNSGGSANWQSVSDSTPDGDTTYVSSATPGTLDTYVMSDLSSTPTTIHAIQANLWARKDNTSGRTLQAAFVIGGTAYEAGSVGPTPSYMDSTIVVPVSPATSAAWTGAEVNGMEMGVNLQA
jgi:hypothetical protein